MLANLLVIESNPDLRKLFDHLLTSDGYQAKTCADWEAAYSAVAQSIPDLIIYDWELNNADGYRWAEVLRNASKTAAIPLLFICDGPPPRHMIERLDGIGISLIDKPFDIFVFRRRIEALLGTRERAVGL